MPIRLSQLTAKEYKDRLKYRCIHRHNGLPIENQHPKCYDEAFGVKPERIGFVDIETGDLKAQWGIVYCYYVLPSDSDEYKHRVVTIKELKDEVYDKAVLKDFIEDIKGFDRLVLQYGTDRKFDLPFLRSRAVKWRLPFPEYKTFVTGDTWTILRNKFCLKGNGLWSACNFFGIPAKGHRINQDIWLGMITGNPKIMQKSLDYISVHCKEDVFSTRGLWNLIYPYVNSRAKTSI